ncbi:SEFIR domain protein [Ancylostoma caninum]|uniref:SEFIR domain protein n=1 Tax=Ancylostoma caninum TaxID=29170 RepID=A0A368GX38_ANCCA|nr:SEFIR domain protein [Ancylostoma caninum]
MSETSDHIKQDSTMARFCTFQYGVDYIPSVIPVEMSSDGRCLCPTSEQHGACSCIAADWKRVRLQRIEKPAPVINATIPTITRQTDENKYWPIYAALIALCLLFSLCFVITVLVMFYRKYSKRGKSVRIRFISDHVSNNGMVAAEPRAPLIYNSPTSVLLVYTHDCPQHEAVVIALAELLRDTFKMDVHLDAWDETEIEKNLYEYINSSIVKADKIVVINSVGAYYRVRARYLGGETIERVHKSPLDGLFMSQIDLVLQHARLISARFSYTPSNCTLFALTPLLQYTIPDNLGLFVASLSDSQLRNDPRLAGFNPQQARLQAAIAAMVQLIEEEPKWFERSHYRVRLPPTVAKPPPRSLDSGIGDSDTAASSAVVPITQPLTLHCAQPDDAASTSSPTGVVVATSPLEEDARPLLEEEAEEVEPVEEKQPHDDVSADSAFHSAVVVDEIPPEREVRDKPRLPRRHEPLHLDGDEAIVEPALLKHRPDMDQNDSGLVSNLTSAQLSV